MEDIKGDGVAVAVHVFDFIDVFALQFEVRFSDTVFGDMGDPRCAVETGPPFSGEGIKIRFLVFPDALPVDGSFIGPADHAIDAAAFLDRAFEGVESFGFLEWFPVRFGEGGDRNGGSALFGIEQGDEIVVIHRRGPLMLGLLVGLG